MSAERPSRGTRCGRGDAERRIHIRDREQSPQARHRRAPQPGRVAGAVVPLVVRRDRGRQRRDLGETPQDQLRAHLGVRVDRAALAGRQCAVLAHDARGDRRHAAGTIHLFTDADWAIGSHAQGYLDFAILSAADGAAQQGQCRQ